MHPWICRIPSLKSSHYLHKYPVLSLVSFSTSIPKISVFDYLVNNQRFSPEFAEEVSKSSPTKYISKPSNAGSVLNFLEEIGFLKSQVEALVQKLPKVLSADLEKTVKPKLKVFQDLGIHSADFADIISTCPWLLTSSADRIRLSILELKNVLGPHVNICRLLKSCGGGRFLMTNLEKTFVPNVEYLKSCGISSSRIATYVSRAPLTYAIKPEKLKDIVQRVDEMGLDRKSKAFIEALKVMSCMSRENWELKLDVFRELGFSEQNILVAFRRMPSVFGASERKIKEVTQLLLSFEDISYIASHPTLLGYSVEKRLKPRLRVLNALLSKNLLKKKPSLAIFVSISNAEFMKKYVSPYSKEVGGLYAVSKSS